MAIPSPSPAVRASQALAVLSLLALVALGLAWELWLAPTGRGTLALKVLPLTLGLAGLLRRRLYTYRWLSLFVWLYVVEGSVRLMAESTLVTGLASAELLLSLLLFVACTWHVRARFAAARALESDLSQASTPS